MDTMAAAFEGMSEQEAREFTDRWLPAWTGNDPERLASFYAEDVFYSDPQVPDGVRGREALTRYFTALLARFPDWVWTNTEAIPMEGGFLNVWHATIPMEGELTVECDGVCTVQLRDGLIARNQVYFDRSELLAAMAELEVGAE
jgi:ketosteroid isomerase-like protein